MTTAALTQVTKRLKFLVAFRPGLISPTLAAQMAASFQRVSGGRLLLNVVVGGDEVEQARFGDFLSKDERYARADDFLAIVRGAWENESFDFAGEHISVSRRPGARRARVAADLLRRLLLGGARGGRPRTPTCT